MLKRILKCNKNAIYHKGICKVGKTNKRLKVISSDVKKINNLLFNPKKQQKDPELFEAVVLRNKLHHFNFLKGRTRILAVGDWKSPTKKRYSEEKNVVIQVQYKDTKNEKIGKELIKRFKRLNNNLIGEELLYTRTIPVEETSLF